jgi:hypothetical protein
LGGSAMKRSYPVLITLLLFVLVLGALVLWAVQAGAMISIDFTRGYFSASVFTTAGCDGLSGTGYGWAAVRRDPIDHHWWCERDHMPCDLTYEQMSQHAIDRQRWGFTDIWEGNRIENTQ